MRRRTVWRTGLLTDFEVEVNQQAERRKPTKPHRNRASRPGGRRSTRAPIAERAKNNPRRESTNQETCSGSAIRRNFPSASATFRRAIGSFDLSVGQRLRGHSPFFPRKNPSSNCCRTCRSPRRSKGRSLQQRRPPIRHERAQARSPSTTTVPRAPAPGVGISISGMM
jgi:hypothetical protein